MVIYLDTSAFLKLYVREAESAVVQELVTSRYDPLPVWDMLQAEITSAIHLTEFWGDLESEEATRLLALFDDRLSRGQYFVPEIDRARLLTTFVDLARHTPDFGCKTMDIFHVACGLQLAPQCFVSFDSRRREWRNRQSRILLNKSGLPGYTRFDRYLIHSTPRTRRWL